MKETYTDIKLNTNYYYLKAFGLAKKSKRIKGNDYWDLHSDMKTSFYLDGYIRKQNNSVFLIPHNYNDSSINCNEQLLFNFDCKIDSSWKINYHNNKSYIQGDSIIFKGKIQSNYGVIYKFLFHPYTKVGQSDYYIDRIFQINVTLKQGIIDVTQFNSPLDTSFTYKAVLFPKQFFVNRAGDRIFL